MPDREPTYASEARSSLWHWALLAVVLVLALAPVVRNPDLVSKYNRGILTIAGINVILAVSLNIINGLAGQFSIGHAGFMAVGAYVAAAITVFGGTALERAAAGGALDPAHPVLNLFLVTVDGAGASTRAHLLAQGWFVIALLAAGVASALVGMLVGIPTLRLRGDYLAIATLGFSEIVRVGLLNLEVMGGASGFNGIAPFGRIPPTANFVTIYLVATVCVLSATALKRSTHGRALLAIREDEVAAEAVGIDTTKYKVYAFALSAFFAGAAGALLAHDQGNLNPAMFNFMRSIEVIAMVVLGGSGSTTGCVLAALLLTGLREGLRDLASYRMVLYAEILVVMMLVRRQGLLGSREITSRDCHRLVEFLRHDGVRGVVRALGGWLRATRDQLRSRLAPADGGRFTAVLATVLLLLPLADLLAAWLLPPSVQPYPRTWAAEIAAELSRFVHAGLLASPLLAPVGQALQLPLVADLGLSVALLILILPWTQLAFGVAAGQRRCGWWALAGAALVAWHGGGLIAVGARLPRTFAELLGGAVVMVAVAVWLARGRRRG